MRQQILLALLVGTMSLLLVSILWMALACTQAAVVGVLTPECRDASCSH